MDKERNITDLGFFRYALVENVKEYLDEISRRSKDNSSGLKNRIYEFSFNKLDRKIEFNHFSDENLLSTSVAALDEAQKENDYQNCMYSIEIFPHQIQDLMQKDNYLGSDGLFNPSVSELTLESRTVTYFFDIFRFTLNFFGENKVIDGFLDFSVPALPNLKIHLSRLLIEPPIVDGNRSLSKDIIQFMEGFEKKFHTYLS